MSASLCNFQSRWGWWAMPPCQPASVPSGEKQGATQTSSWSGRLDTTNVHLRKAIQKKRSSNNSQTARIFQINIECFTKKSKKLTCDLELHISVSKYPFWFVSTKTFPPKAVKVLKCFYLSLISTQIISKTFFLHRKCFILDKYHNSSMHNCLKHVLLYG